MTLVGRILVVVLVFFSIGFLFFAVAVYSTQTNWRVAHTNLTKEIDKVKKQNSDLQKQKENLDTELTKEKTSHEKAVKDYETRITELNKGIEKKTADWQDAQKKAEENKATADTAIAETTQRREEVNQLRDQLQKIRSDFEVKAAQARQLDETLHETRRNLDVAKERQKQLEKRVTDLSVLAQKSGIDIHQTVPPENAPPPEVEGVVKRVESNGRYVEISLGSDNDLRKGNRLDVYRMKPAAKYLGRIQIMEADPQQSVARILETYLQGQIKEGDIVTTRIR